MIIEQKDYRKDEWHSRLSFLKIYHEELLNHKVLSRKELCETFM
jgi:hypothetical protein